MTTILYFGGVKIGYTEKQSVEDRVKEQCFKVQVYGLAPTESIYRIAKHYILGFDEPLHIDDADHHLRHADALPAAKE